MEAPMICPACQEYFQEKGAFKNHFEGKCQADQSKRDPHALWSCLCGRKFEGVAAAEADAGSANVHQAHALETPMICPECHEYFQDIEALITNVPLIT